MAGREGGQPEASGASLAEGATGVGSGVPEAGGGTAPATLPASGQWLGEGMGYHTGATRGSGGADFSPDRGGSSEVMRSLVGQKEKELHDMNEYRIHALECSVAERDRQVAELRVSLRGMKADFEFNLKLIEDRDAEYCPPCCRAGSGRIRSCGFARLADTRVDEREREWRLTTGRGQTGAVRRGVFDAERCYAM